MNLLGLLIRNPKWIIGGAVAFVFILLLLVCKHNGKLSQELKQTQSDNVVLQHDIQANDDATLVYSLSNDTNRNAQNSAMLSTLTTYQREVKGKPNAPKVSPSTRIDKLHSGLHDVYTNANGTDH